MARLEGKIAVITGAADGIGHAIAEAMAREGAHVFLGDIADEAGEDFAAALRTAGQRAEYVHCDVAQEADIASLIGSAVKKAGRLDILDRKSTRLNSSHVSQSRMPSSA